MNHIPDTDTPFESQLTRSARRLCEEQNYQLPLRPSPRRRHTSITWIASVAAACIGWFVGILFPLGEQLPETGLAVQVCPDTVIQYKDRLVHDTVIHRVEVPVKVHVQPAPKSHPEYESDPQGCNVECDGINYAMLVGM